MTEYRKIISMKQQGASNSEIAVSISCSRGTVIDTLKRMERYNLPLPLKEELTDTDIHRILHPRIERKDAKVAPDTGWLAFTLGLPNSSIQGVYDRYKEKYAPSNLGAYSLTQFKSYVYDAQRSSQPRGSYSDSLTIWYEKNLFAVIQPDTAKLVYIQGIVAKQAYSDYISYRLLKDQSAQHFTDAITALLKDIGGIPKQMNVAGTMPKKLSSVMAELGKYYEIQSTETKEQLTLFPDPIIANSFAELDNRIATIIQNYNLLPWSDTQFTRENAKNALLQYIKPIPAVLYEPAEWVTVKPQLNGHVQVDRQYYSFPSKYRFSSLRALVQKSTITIYHKDTLLCKHGRLYGRPGQYSTDPAHMPTPGHSSSDEWDGARIRNWARKIGPKTSEVIDYFLNRGIAEQQGYKICLGLLTLSSKHGDSKLECACATELQRTAVPRYKNILDLMNQ